jgi:hypothetical protein
MERKRTPATNPASGRNGLMNIRNQAVELPNDSIVPLPSMEIFHYLSFLVDNMIYQPIPDHIQDFSIGIFLYNREFQATGK